MSRAWITSAALIGVSVAAFLVASPWHEPLAATWLPAAEFAIGVTLVTLSFLELGRATAAWLARAAPLAWIAAGVLVGVGLFAAGSALMVGARERAFDWIAIAGILVSVVGVRWQWRTRRPAEREVLR